MNDKLGKVLRMVAIVFMGLTTAMNIFGGAGTTCAAFLTKDYPPYWVLIKPFDVQWLWQLFVVLTLAIGIAGIVVTVQLVRGKKNSYHNAVILLVIGSIWNGIHVYASWYYLEAVVPIIVVFLLNLITLIYFLILGIPGLRERVNFTKTNDASDNELASGMAAIVVGVVTLTMPIWAGPSHMFEGENWVYVLQLPINIVGSVLTLGGSYLVLRVGFEMFSREIEQAKKRLLGIEE